MKYYIHCLRNYANFSGRARRSEYWFFILFHFIFMMAMLLVFNFFDGFSGVEDGTSEFTTLPAILYFIYFAAVFIPSLAVTARRLHDMGKSGTWFFIYFVPFVGGIWLLVLLFTDSQPGMNKWGYNPKEEGIDEISQIGNYLTP
ncbi:MAG: rane protein [Ferruginibacter sp.]|nr:rane protein [Ferruginibacter sp.]